MLFKVMYKVTARNRTQVQTYLEKAMGWQSL